MKLLLLSDIHLVDNKPEGRIDDIQAEQCKKLKFVIDYANKNKCTILSAGDLVDKPKPWNLLSMLIRYFKKVNAEWYAVQGQHDQYFRASQQESNTVYGALTSIPLIHDISGKQIEIGPGVFVTGVGWDQKIPKGNIEAKRNILVIHAPIGTTALFPDHQYNDAMRFLREHKTYNLILVGDIHRHFMLRIGKRSIVNCGPMLRLHADKYNFKHEPCFYVYNTITSSLERIIIPHKKAKEVLSRVHIEKKEEVELLLENFVSNLRSKKAFVAGVDIVANINRWCKQNKVPKSIKRRISRLMEE